MDNANAIMLAAQKMLILYQKGQFDALWEQYLCEDTVLFLPNRATPLYGKEEIANQLFCGDAVLDFSEHVRHMEFFVRKTAESLYILYGAAGADAFPLSSMLSGQMPANLSCVFKKTDAGHYRLCTLHTSFPIAGYGPHRMVTDLFGAVFLCRCDKYLSLLQMNNRFLVHFGYTPEELQALFDNSFLAMVHPDDRQNARHIPVKEPAGALYETELRVSAKGGGYKWALLRRQLTTDVRGRSYLSCVLIDITAGKQLRDQLEASLARHEIIISQTNDIIFEWDIRTDTISFSPSGNKLLRNMSFLSAPTNYCLSNSHIHPDDMVVIKKITEGIHQGVPYVEGELRLMDEEGRYLWCRVRATQQFGENNEPIRSIGVICNIDEEKRRSLLLAEKAERDALTNVYNRGAVQALITERLQKRDKHSIDALLVLDIDNFKSINDSAGHLSGDHFLTYAATCLKRVFRTTDLIGRIGGDEFIVFVKDIPDVSMLRQKAEQALKVIREPQRIDERIVTASCSIGIALAGPNAIFDEVYYNADWALYQAKRSGKNCYVLYEHSDAPHCLEE